MFMIKEVGSSWGKLDPSDQWDERVMGLIDSTAVFAHNTTDPDLSEKPQCGGAGMVATAKVKHKIIDQGEDPSGMGRWVWMQMEGEEGHHVRFVAACRPCQSDGSGSAFQQRARAMAKNKDCRNPRTAIMQEWKLQCDHVILGMDANEDVRHGEVHDLLEEAGLREVILELHDDSSPPATQNRKHRREPIDGFWAASGITVARGGCLA
jgi:hypothetical protein